ncbi:MAG: nuclear transport factor 2 family protein [Betaproteobacteria bacterium]|nr:nuclear transport factor 2 family protein [Betaproteobacteria bacterium]
MNIAASQQEVVSALDRYRELMLRMEYGLLSELFTPDAEISHGAGKPIVGREKIQQLLASFAGYKILEYELIAEHTQAGADRARQTGRYAQTVLTPEGKTITVRGTFDATWLRTADKRWYIERMHTESAP